MRRQLPRLTPAQLVLVQGHGGVLRELVGVETDSDAVLRLKVCTDSFAPDRIVPVLELDVGNMPGGHTIG